MSNTTNFLEDARTALAADGFYCIQDPTVGLRISEMERYGFQFTPSKKPGLEFCKVNVLSDEGILTSFFGACGLGYYERIAEDKGHIFQLRRGGENPDILLIQLWSKGSRVVYYRRSHTILSNSTRAANGLWEVPSAVLARANIDRAEKLFENGGMVVLDARLAFEMTHGSPITCGFAKEDELRKWKKMPPPDSEDAAQWIADLNTGNIGANFGNLDEKNSGDAKRL